MFFTKHNFCSRYIQILVPVVITFFLNNKTSLLGLLFTLVHLCKGIPLQPLRLDFSRINFSSHPHSKFSISWFSQAGRTTEKGERRAEPIRACYSPTWPPQRHYSPPRIPLINPQGKIHAAPRHWVLPRTTGGMFPLIFARSFVYAFTLFFLRYFLDGIGITV